MTIEQLYEDTVDLIKLLLARFEKEKLVLLGHSWGGLLATRVATRHPELLHAVILMNPTIDNRRGEDISYRWVLERARTANDDKAVRVLEKLANSDTYGKEGRFIERKWSSVTEVWSTLSVFRRWSASCSKRPNTPSPNASATSA
jgi:pimeloyl-ACP methyl ester carboxylesterase